MLPSSFAHKPPVATHAMAETYEQAVPYSAVGSAMLILTQCLLLLAIPVLFYQLPYYYVRFIAEDNWGAFASSAAFLLAAILFARLSYTSGYRIATFWYALLALATFLVGMEEISWGQRIFKISTPEFIGAHNYQNEITLHNIESLGLSNRRAYQVLSCALIGYGLILPLLCISSQWIQKLIGKAQLPLPSLVLTPLFLSAAALFLWGPLERADEIGELLFALSFAAFAGERTLVETTQQQLKPGLGHGSYALIPIVTALGTGILLTTLFSGPAFQSSQAYANNLEMFAIQKLPKANLHRQALSIIDYMQRHPSLATGNTSLHRAELLTSLRRVEEAAEAYQHALQFDEQRLKMAPGNLDNLRSISAVYASMGDNVMAARYLQKTFNAYDAKMAETSAAPARTGADMVIWNGESYPVSSIYYRHRYRGECHHDMGESQQALEEYLLASDYAHSPRLKRELEYRITNTGSSLCGKRLQRVLWPTIEALSRNTTAVLPTLCRQPG